jgi:hypothetical protein
MMRKASRPAGTIVFLSLILIVFFAACTGQPPEIVKTFWQINIVQDTEQGISYQSLSLFVKPKDPDGFEDIEDVYLINDEQELFWRLDAETWAQSGTGEEVWIGSNSLRMPDGASFPDGLYRILLRDVGGDSAEQTIRLPSISLAEMRTLVPKVVVVNGKIEISGGSGSYLLWLYDSNKRYLSAYPGGQGSLQVAKIVGSQPSLQGGFSFKVYRYIEERSLGVIAGPYFVKP